MTNTSFFRSTRFAFASACVLTLSSCSLVGSNESAFTTLQLAPEAPSVTITSPAEGTFITTANFEDFTLSGFCFYDGGTVTVATEPPIFRTTTCAGNSWTVSVDVSFLFDGPLNFVVNHTGPQNETVPTFERIYVKDTIAPQGNSIKIGDGFTPLLGPATVLTLSSSGATQMYITNTAGCTTGGTLMPFATTANWMVQPVGNTATVYAKFLDDAGNASPCVNASIGVNFAPAPTVAITAPAPGTIISAALAPALHLGGTCSESGRAVSIAGSATATATCTNSSWEVILDLSALPDGPLAFTATHSNPYGLNATAFASYMKDTGVPTVAILLPVAGSYVNLANQAAFAVSGTCSENGRTVVLSGAVNSSAPCTSGAWSASLNLSAVPDGNVVVHADLSDFAGNAAVRSTKTYIKDTVAPTGTLSINGGAASTTSTSVTLTLNAAGASEMYITNTAGCTAGGTFEAYSTSKPWTLGQTNGTATVYAAFRDLAGNTGPCVNDQIAHSNLVLSIAPTSISLPSSAAQTTTFTATGGAGGYVFSVISGNGTINASSGVYNVAAGAAGTTLIRVTDSAGKTADATVTHTSQSQLVFDGAVQAIGIDADGNRYYGGKFTRIAGAMTPGVIGLDSLGNPSGTFNPAVGFNGAVNAVIYLADGSIIAGGNFSTYRGAPANRIAHLSPAGLLDVTFSPSTGANGFDGAVKALAYDSASGAIYVGGEFTKYRGAPASGIAKLNLAGQLNTVFNPSSGTASSCANAAVNAIVIGQGSVFIGGNFTQYRGLSANRIAKLNASTGALDTGFSPSSGNGFNGTVYSLAMNGTHLYAGGSFRTYRSAAANGIAKLSLSGSLDTGFNPSYAANGVSYSSTECAIVYAIAIADDGVYLGGSFLKYRGTLVNHLAKVNFDGTLDSDFLAPSESGTRGKITGLALNDETLYLVGPFTHYRAKLVNGIAKVSAQNGAIDTGFNSSGLGFSHEGEVPALATIALSSDGGQMIVGGDIVGSLYQGTVTGHLVKVKATGDADLAFSSSAKVDAAVDAIAISSRTIYIGGHFHSVSGKIAHKIAKLNQSGALDTTFSPQSGANGVNGPVYALAVHQNTLYAGGAFTTYRGATSNHLVRVTSAGVRESSFDCNTGMNGNVRALALALNGSILYAGGEFTTFRGKLANRIAKIVTATAALDTTFNPQSSGSNGMDSSVMSLAVAPSGTKVYVGGRFNKYRGNTANRLLRLNSDGSLDGAFFTTLSRGDEECPFLSVDAIAVDSTGKHVFAGGQMIEMNGTTVNHIAHVSDAGLLDSNFTPAGGPAGVNLLPGGAVPIQAIAIDGTLAHIGGTFTSYRQMPVQNLAIVDFAGALAQ